VSLSIEKKLAGLLMIGAVAGSTFAAEPNAPEPALPDQIKELRAKLDQLESREAAQEQKQEERQQQATLESTLQDAEQHSRLLDVTGINAGFVPGRGFFLSSDDGNFLLHPWLQFQFRNTTTYREDALHKGHTDDTQTGFEVRRLKFGVDGNLFSPDLTYMFQMAVDRHTGNVGLEMAWAKYHFPNTPFAVRAGQFKDPLDHEELAASRFFSAADRSLIDDTFINGEGFIKGVSVIYDPNTFVRGEAAFTGGIKNFNTNFQQFPTNPASWGAAARGEIKAFGDWRDYERISAYGIRHDSLVLGAGLDNTETGPSDSLVQVVDAQYQTRSGLSLYGAFLGRYMTQVASKNTKGVRDTYDSTARFQASYAIDRHWEPYGRFEYIHFNGHEFAARTQTNVQVITGGFNYYLYGQAAKFTVDLSYLPNGSPIADDGFGILASNRQQELVGRAQLQVVF
jgi:hypothetical protein